MEDLRQYVIFAQTATLGSMSAAAKRLGLTPSAVSQTIRALEARTGVALLRRSTRKLSLTEAGERCLPYCLRLLEAGDAAAASLKEAREAPVGELRVAAPDGFGAHLSLALAPIFADWDALRLRLLVNDQYVDLIDERIDIALRVGDPPDSNWIGRKLCDYDRILCASPDYLALHGAPDASGDLCKHDWLATGAAANAAADQDGKLALDFANATGVRERLRVPLRAVATSQVALQQLCEQGMGIAILYYPEVRTALARGDLVRLLHDWRLTSEPLTMMLPRGIGEPTKVSIAASALKIYFAALDKLDYR